ncbi:Myb-like protein L [Smittium mucronatum]|uniref:Myb-like protein L n=1 Tax=Smittium mucronatum TaxID=133383 RepID=A0A1R0H7Y2_9FUNG|nr:Myb-like protein L [Smittium mucronatum]
MDSMYNSPESHIGHSYSSLQGESYNNWDLITAYRLNVKLQKKFVKSLKSINKALKTNKEIQLELFKLSYNDIKKQSGSSAKSNLGTRNPLGLSIDTPPTERLTDVEAFKNQFIKKRKGRKENSENSCFDKFMNYSDVLFDRKPGQDYISKPNNQNPIISRAKRWTSSEKRNLALGVRQLNKQILIKKIIEDSDLSPAEKKHNIEMINRVKSKALEMNIDGLNWKEISSSFVPTQKPSACAIQWATHGHPIINKKPWSGKEIVELRKSAQELGERDWVTIAQKLDTNRTAQQCFKLYQRKINTKLTLSKWTKQEDNLLKNLVIQYGQGSWQTISSCFYGRTGQQILHRWHKSINPSLKSGKWSPEEDTSLIVGVNIFGVGKWNKICQFVPGRTDVKCRERYVNVLAPNLNRGRWTPIEDYKLTKAVREVGVGKWSLIAEMVGTRTDSQCWRHWLTLDKRGINAKNPLLLTDASSLPPPSVENDNNDKNDDEFASTANPDLESVLTPNIDSNLEIDPETVELPAKRYLKHRDLEEIDQNFLKKRRWKRFDNLDPTVSNLDILESEISESDLSFFKRSKKYKNVSKSLVNRSAISSQENEDNDISNITDPSPMNEFPGLRKIIPSSHLRVDKNNPNLDQSGIIQSKTSFVPIIDTYRDFVIDRSGTISFKKVVSTFPKVKTPNNSNKTSGLNRVLPSKNSSNSKKIDRPVPIYKKLKSKRLFNNINWSDFLNVDPVPLPNSMHSDNAECGSQEIELSLPYNQRKQIEGLNNIGSSYELSKVSQKNKTLAHSNPIPANIINTLVLSKILGLFPELVTAFNSGLLEIQPTNSLNPNRNSDLAHQSQNLLNDRYDSITSSVLSGISEELLLESRLRNILLWPLLLGLTFPKKR